MANYRDRTQQPSIFKNEDLEIGLWPSGKHRYTKDGESWIAYTFEYRRCIDITVRLPEMYSTVDEAAKDAFEWIRENPGKIEMLLEEARQRFREEDYHPGTEES